MSGSFLPGIPRVSLAVIRAFLVVHSPITDRELTCFGLQKPPEVTVTPLVSLISFSAGKTEARGDSEPLSLTPSRITHYKRTELWSGQQGRPLFFIIKVSTLTDATKPVKNMSGSYFTKDKENKSFHEAFFLVSLR